MRKTASHHRQPEPVRGAAYRRRSRAERVVKKEHADDSVTQSQFDSLAAFSHRRMRQAGRQNTVRIGDGSRHTHHHAGRQEIGILHNNQNQLTSASGPDGLEMRRNMMSTGV